jgi:alpha-beta hydrolase superfamily lysophospholipase
MQKRVWWVCLLVFILINIVACFHAYKFTHFAAETIEKTKSAKALSVGEKLETLFFGVNNPRPTNKIQPTQSFETVFLQSNRKIECWHIKLPNSKGTVAIFPGYSGSKSLMLDKSDEFIRLGYSTLLVDFAGTGGSEGNQTTIGYKEARDVKTCFKYLSKQGENNIILFGTSMGAVAILKAAQDYSLAPAGAILECPFGSMYQTTCARFRQMGVPCFPMAGLLVFWGGIQNEFWGFSHNPQAYAKHVKFPVLLLYGEKDAEVSREETNEIYASLAGKKRLSTYPEAGHENYLKRYKKQWQEDVTSFLQETTL